MRIISGQYRGRTIVPPRNLRARPTTDFAKEALFNVLAGYGFDYEECDVLDLFAGTGSVSYEFASRGAGGVTAVELNAVHCDFIRRTAAELAFERFYTVKANVFNYLKACTRRFDIVFSDAPYDLRGSEQVVDLVFERGLLVREGDVRPDGSVADRDGLLIFEHSAAQNFAAHPRFRETRNYGSVHFTMLG
jgi:16S rRNA (guanine(966)-N(2))-methyltransferase RsmD